MPFKSPEQQRYLRGLTRPKAVRVNIEVVYDDGTFDELALDRPMVSRLYNHYCLDGNSCSCSSVFQVSGEQVSP